MFLTALARETDQIRLGFGIGTCVPAMHSPIRWAEKAAFLDMLSNGRVDFGTGRSSTCGTNLVDSGPTLTIPNGLRTSIAA